MDKSTSFSKSKSINCGGKLLDLSTPLVMGILNCTDDSFYDGGLYNTEKNWLLQTEKMLSDGAAMIDIGAESTRPGATPTSADQELKMLCAVINSVKKHFPGCIVSADTYRGTTAKAAAENGADIINDISGGTFDSNMFNILPQLHIPYILSHIKGSPQTMHQPAHYTHVAGEIIKDLSAKVEQLHSLGVNDIIIDPGVGFGKNVEQNFKLLNQLDLFNCFEQPLLIGLSRKSLIWKTLNISPAEALNGTTALNLFALHKGATILRVHDVKEAVEVIKLYTCLNK